MPKRDRGASPNPVENPFALTPRRFPGHTTTGDRPRLATLEWERGNAWKAVQLTEGRMQLFPPGEPTEIKYAPHIKPGASDRPLLMLGEAGSGISSFMNWVRGRTERQKGDRNLYLHLDWRRISGRKFQNDPQRAIADHFAAMSSDELKRLSPMAQAATEPGHLVEALAALAKDEHREPLVLCVEELSSLPPDVANELLARLRGFIESGYGQKVRIVATATDEANLLHQEPYSSFLPICDVFRMPSFSGEELQELWQNYGWRSKNAVVTTEEASEAGAAALRWTGGQPLLTMLFFGYAWREAAKADTRTNPEFDDCGNWLLRHPPAAHLAQWRRRLAQVIKTNSFLHRRVTAYADGQTDGTEVLEAELQPLFVTGWIGQDEHTRRWGIRSACHATWIKDALRNPTRYLGGAA
jgi:hypothetical protein